MTATTTRAPAVAGSAGLLALLGALTGLTPFAVDAYLPALPAITRDLGTTSSATQLTLAALMLGLALGQLVIGPMSDRFGRRPPVLLGVAGFIATSVGSALAPDVGALVVLRFLQGVTGAAAVVVARAVVRDVYEGPESARAFARLILVMGAAPVLAPVVGAQVLRLTSWRGVFVLLAVVGALLLVITARRLPETLPPERRHGGGTLGTLRVFGRLLRDPGFVLAAGAGGAAFAAMFAYIGGSPFLLQELFDLSPAQFSAVFGLNAAVFVLLSQVSARLVRRTGPAPLVVAGAVQSSTGAVLLLVSLLAGWGLPGVLPALALVVSAVGFVAPNATALALAEHGRTAGTASALVGLLQFVLGAVAAPLTGVGGSRSGLPMAVVIAVAAGTSLLCAALAARRIRAGALGPAG